MPHKKLLCKFGLVLLLTLEMQVYPKLIYFLPWHPDYGHA